jgi:hypothetical protein
MSTHATASFVIQHGGIRSGESGRTFGHIVPGSGTAELRGLRGDVEIKHDETGAVFSFEYDFE